MSDIWNEFEKIAVEQGLICTAADESEREQEDPAKMPARYDSLSDDAIRLLYGVEPESIFEKNKTIIEIAHPETAIVGRTYDAMNAVIENLHERQDMMAYIALKMPNGNLTQRRYIAARQDLVNTLVRSAFLLENRDESELVTLADSCTERLVKKKIVKEAVGPLAIAGIAAGVAVLIGAANYFINGAPTAQNVYANSQVALDALEPLMSEPYAQGISSSLRNLMAATMQMKSIGDSLSQIQTVSSAVNVVQNNAAAVEKFHQRIQSHIDYLQRVVQTIPTWVATVKKTGSTEVESDWYAKLKGLVGAVWDDDKQTLIKALAGENAWLGLGGQTGGLLEALKNDIAAWSLKMQQGQGQVEQAVQTIQQPQVVAPQIQQPQAQVVSQKSPARVYPQSEYLIQEKPSRLPTAVPAPTPIEPAGAARVRPQEETGFGGLQRW